MIYRPLGNTGKDVSIIGLGLEHVDRKPYEQVKETMDAALAHGINIMDVFMPGDEVRENIAKAFGTRRREVMLQGHIGATDINQQYDISRDMPTVKKYFEKLLKLFGYIDFGMLFFIDSDEDFKNVFDTEFITYAQQLKRNGDIHHIGFSSHNPVTAKRVIETGTVEMMMFSVNPAFDMLPADRNVFDLLENKVGKEALHGIDPHRAALYALCEQKGIGITTMKSYGSGKLLSPDHTPYARPLTVHQCTHYALSRPAVASVLPGCKTAAEMEQIIAYCTATAAERDYAEVLATVRNDFRGNCVYCSHCQPCPVNIDIAAVHRYFDIAKLDIKNIPPSIKSHYASLQSAECINCGHCEKRCPFGVEIIKNIKEATRLLKD
ncbi:MAG: aldo/keto reductase [Defluviitaleaceae bacterium]|nr:aldo/keto reductase [Defluviitaleaceae bacterium]MCL2263947.1 aldo/keto reductase [Defluviitaleaceae bacterium]